MIPAAVPVVAVTPVIAAVTVVAVMFVPAAIPILFGLTIRIVFVPVVYLHPLLPDFIMSRNDAASEQPANPALGNPDPAFNDLPMVVATVIAIGLVVGVPAVVITPGLC